MFDTLFANNAKSTQQPSSVGSSSGGKLFDNLFSDNGQQPQNQPFSTLNQTLDAQARPSLATPQQQGQNIFGSFITSAANFLKMGASDVAKIANNFVNMPLGLPGSAAPSLAQTYSQAMDDLKNSFTPLDVNPAGGLLSPLNFGVGHAYAPANENQSGNVKELAKQQQQLSITDPMRRYGNDIVDTLLSTLQGASANIFKNPIKNLSPEAHIIEPIAQTAGQIWSLDKLGNGIEGLLGKTPLITAVAQYPKLSFIPKLLSNVGAFDIYGQLNPDVKDRLKQLVSDTEQGTLLTVLGTIGKARYSIPLAFGGGFGLAKLNGASNKDALVSGLIFAALEGANKIPGLFDSQFKNGSRVFTPQEARDLALNSNFKDTPLAKDLLKNSFEAERTGKNIRVDLGAAQKGIGAKLLNIKAPEGIGYNISLVEGPPVPPALENPSTPQPAAPQEAVTPAPDITAAIEDKALAPIINDAAKYQSAEDFAKASFSTTPDKQIGAIDPHTLIIRDPVDKNSEQYKSLLADVNANGFKEPINIDATGQRPITVDGSHRAQVAQDLGIKVPVIVNKGTIPGLPTIQQVFDATPKQQPTETAPTPVESPSTTKAAVTPQSPTAELRDRIDKLMNGLDSLPEAQRTKAIQEEIPLRRALNDAYDKEKETVFDVPKPNYAIPYAHIEIFKYSDGKYAYRVGVSTNTGGFHYPFIGKYATKAEAIRAGAEEIKRWIENQLNSNNLSAGDKKVLNNVLEKLKGLKLPREKKILQEGKIITVKSTDELLQYIDRQGYRTPEQVAKLRADIIANGITYPVELLLNKDGTYEISDGTHRIQIAKDLGIKEIPVKITRVEANTESVGELTLHVTKAETPEEVQAEITRLGLPESVLKFNARSSGKQFTYSRPLIGKTDIKTLLANSPEFKKNPVLTVEKGKEGKLLVFSGKKINFKITAAALRLKEENLQIGDKVRVDEKMLKGTSDQMRVSNASGVYASTGSSPIGKFETVAEQKVSNLKLFEKAKDLIRKYAERIGEGYLPRGAAGAYHVESKNIRISGLNNLSTAVHEITHAIDKKYNISEQIRKKIGENKLGLPLYDRETAGIRHDMTKLYSKYYPTGSAAHSVNKRMTEGFATLVQKYVEMPTTIEKEFPTLVNEFLKPEGKYYNNEIGSLLKDVKEIVANYQGLSALDKVGSRVVNETLKTDKSWLRFFEKVRTFMEDEIYPVEKLGKIAGTQWSGEDPSLWLRQYSRGGGIYANNILNGKTGYWTINEQGEAGKILDYNWKTLADLLQKEKNVEDFGYFLVARDQTAEWQELDRLEKDYNRKKVILDLMERFGIDNTMEDGLAATADEMGIDPKEVIDLITEAKQAEKAYLEQKKYLANNGFLREEVQTAYRANITRFAKETVMYDALVRADLTLLHNPQVGLVNKEAYDRYTSKEGYASMKRAFFDDIIGAEKAQYGGGGKGTTRISSLKKRIGGEQQIINPVLNGMINHIEITKKSIKQIIYNKIAQIAVKGTAGELLQRLELRSFKDDTGKITFPQERDENIIMARLNYKRTPILVDKTIKNTVDTVLTFQNMNIFEHILTSASRLFTVGTTGAYAPFSLVNYPADQWNAVLNTRNGYKPLVDQIKVLGQVITQKGGPIAHYWHEWEIMGGDRMTLFQSQLDSTTNAVKYITKETKGLEIVIGALDKVVDIASIPAKYSETASRFSEYVAARKAGKPQVVALEEAGRITAPFHHIGSWKFGDRASAKFWIRSVPFMNASLQVVAQAVRTAETPAGRKRLVFVLLAATAAYLSSMAMISLFGSKDQKEQYKDLRPTDIASYLHYPALAGQGLIRVRISQEFSTIGTLLSMVIAQNILNVRYSPQDYLDAATNWIPRQINVLQPVEAFISWFNPLIKVPLELVFNVKDYPRISPIENLSMQAREPRDRYNAATSGLAKALGSVFNISPIKIDFLVSNLFGRATGFLTLKPQIYNPISTVQRQYLFTLGRRVENFYQDSQTVDQQIKSLKDKWQGQTNIPTSVKQQFTALRQKQLQYNALANYLKLYGKIDQNDSAKLQAARDKIIPLLEKVGEK